MRRFQILFTLVCFFLGIRYAPAYEIEGDGVLFKIEKQRDTDARWMKIFVCTEDIIRVVASPDESFSTRPSLIVDKVDWEPAAWSVNEKGSRVDISTPKLTVRVRPETGAVAFYDANGTLILQEKTDGGKIITPAEVMGERTFHIQQIFDSPEDEAFYGLGQHQNAVMNYKGHDVDLWQHNMVAVNPFLVSSRNYGILWDNASRTKFGDIRDYQTLSSLNLYNHQGEKVGLTVSYYRDPDFRSLLVSQNESAVAHDFIDQPGDYPRDFDLNRGSIRWSGELASEQAGTHKFRLYSSGYTRMWLDGEVVVDSWRQNWLPWTHLIGLDMEAGKRYPIQIEWIPTGGYIGLTCLDPEDDVYRNSLSLYSEVADQIDYYFVYGDDLDQVIHGYRGITGRAPMMPKWAMGFWQSRERYRTQEELLSVVREFRKRRIPLDNIIQDWFYWKEDDWGSHEFDASRYPDPEGMIEMLHDDLHTRVMISIWPKFYVGTKHYEEFRQAGRLYMRNVEKEQRDWVGPGYVSTFYDPYSEDARGLFWKQIHEKLFDKGIDAWWLDCTEPDIQSNLSRRETILRQSPTSIGSGARYLNTYSLMNAQGVYESQRETSPDQRVFILTRSAFAGQQRYSAATWSGDVAARWYDLKAQIPAGLNFSISGIPYWTTDIGGFAVEPRYEHPNESDLEEWRELNTRWFQFGAFCPLFRSHGQYPYREMFHIAPDEHPAYQTMLAYDKLRYRLMPYIYSLAGSVTHSDYTIMRALVMDFGHDKKVYNIADAYMFGPALLVNPVFEYKARTRTVYLPSNTGWYALNSGRHFEGGRTIQADAPYTDIPIFVKEGSIIPFGPELQYSDEKPADPIRLYVYTGSSGSFTLYEDENVNFNYEKGLFSTIPFRYSEKDRVLIIGNRQGEFPGMLKTRMFDIVWVDPENPAALDFDGAPALSVLYNGTEHRVKHNGQRR